MMWRVATEPKVITKVIEIDETAPMSPMMYPPYWPPVPGAGQLPRLQPGTVLDKDEDEEKASEQVEETDKLTEPASGETVERRRPERKEAERPAKDFEDNMMDYVPEKSEKDEDDDDRRKKKKKKRKKKKEKEKKKKKKPKRKKKKKRKQRKKQTKRRKRRKKRQQKRKQ